MFIFVPVKLVYSISAVLKQMSKRQYPLMVKFNEVSMKTYKAGNLSTGQSV